MTKLFGPIVELRSRAITASPSANSFAFVLRHNSSKEKIQAALCFAVYRLVAISNPGLLPE